MGDNHVIRVIIQGFDRLSGVMRDAANRSGPAMDGLRNKVNRLRNENQGASKEVDNLARRVSAAGDRFDDVNKKVVRFQDSIKKLRDESHRTVESADDMFNRLGREGASPRAGGRFQSREAFTAQENARRSADANARLSQLRRQADQVLASVRSNVQRTGIGIAHGDALEDDRRANALMREQESLFGRLRAAKNRLYEGAHPFDEIWKGFREGVTRSNQNLENVQDTLAAARFESQRRIAQFDQDRLNERRKKEQDNAIQRADTEKRLKEEEEQVRESLARRENQRDKFLNREALSLKQFRIKRDADLANQTDEDRRIAASTSKKLAAERPLARERIRIAREVAANETAIEESANAERVNEIQRRYRDLQRGRLNEIRERERAEISSVNEVSRTRLQTFDDETKVQRNKLRETERERVGNLPDLVRQRNAQTSFIPQNATIAEVVSAKITQGISDFRRGVNGGRRDLAEFRGEAGSAQRTMAQFGAEVGKATRGIGNFINLRWLLVVSAVASLVTIVTQLGAALVAVASSAAFAAAGLGGALLAGAAEAIPVVGLLAATFHELQNAMKVVQLRQDARNRSAVDQVAQDRARRSAAEGLSDAHYALGQAIQNVADAEHNLAEAHQRVTDAEKQQKDAALDLIDARRNAVRKIVDSAFAERDARLSVKEAEQGVLDAKKKLADFEDARRLKAADLSDAQKQVTEAQDRLKAARAQGDATEIAAAGSALAAAKGNVSALKDQIATTANQQKDLRLGVQRATLEVEQSHVRAKRATEDNNRVQKQGVNQSPEVRNAVDRLAGANRSLRDAVYGVHQAQLRVVDSRHAVVIANRNIADSMLAVKDAADKMSAAQRNADREFLKLSPAQRDFVRAMEEFQRTYKKFINPITDIITGAFSRGLRRASQLLKDRQIRSALEELATQIATIGDKFTKWVVSPEGRRTLTFFITSATRNLPIIADAAGKFATALLNISKAATPLFNHLVDLIDSFAGKTEKATSNSDKLNRFFTLAGKHLDAWLKLIGAVGRFFGALIGASAGSGLKMVKGMTDAFNDLADKIDKNRKKIGDFFEQVRRNLGRLLPVIGKAATQLLNAFTSKSFIDFTTFVIQTMVPGLVNLIKILGFLAGALTDLFKAPVIGPAAQFAAQLGLGYLAARKLFPFLKIMDPFLKALFLAPIASLKNLAGGFLLLGARIKTFIALAKTEGIIATLGAQFPKLAAGIRLVGAALRFVFITNPWIAIVIGIIAIIVLLDRKFHFLRPTIMAIKRAAEFVFNWIKDNWKLLLAIILGPFTLAAAGIWKFKDKIIGIFKDLIAWIRTHWKLLVEILVAIFLFPAGPIAVAIFRWHDKIIQVAEKVVKGIANWFKKLPGMIFNAIKGLPDTILNLFTGLGERILKKIVEKIPGLSEALGFAGKIIGAVSGVAKKADPRKVISAAKTLFRADGGVIPEYLAPGGLAIARGTDTVPAMLTPGEWVLNAKQQQKLAVRLGTPVGDVRKFIFGSKPQNNPISNTASPNTLANGVQLIPHKDDYGITLWWLRMGDGTWAQVSQRGADKIIKSRGTWLPGYVRRAGVRAPLVTGTPGHKPEDSRGNRIAFNSGGIVSFRSTAARGYASGGVVRSGTVIASPSKGGNTVNQAFTVQSEGESDWNYIMRLGAQHAQESY